MKKVIISIIVSIIIISILTVVISAFSLDLPQNAAENFLRAGGAGGGGGGGSGKHYSTGNPILDLILFIFASIFSICSSLAFFVKLTKTSRQSRRLMKQMARSDNAWKYDSLLTNVENAYFSIQKAWSNSNMTSASCYMSDDLFDEFQSLLEDMKKRKERNVLEDIKLLKALPVFVYDNENNENDFVWFYIKGSMVDYTINTETKIKVSGTYKKEAFIEYWRFVRKEDRWVLNKILQENQSNQIPF